MRLSPADRDKLLLATAGMVARDRRARGVKLNHPETVALLSCWVIEGARDGRSVAELRGAQISQDNIIRAMAEGSAAGESEEK
jgi:urease subunit gamma